jgi:polar amino acid transport system permease protein
LRLILVILPQAGRIAIPPTVGFLVQLIKATALTSIIGFTELTRTGEILANATLKPFPIYGLVAIFYFALCYPLTSGARRLERHGQALGVARLAPGSPIRS